MPSPSPSMPPPSSITNPSSMERPLGHRSRFLMQDSAPQAEPALQPQSNVPTRLPSFAEASKPPIAPIVSKPPVAPMPQSANAIDPFPMDNIYPSDGESEHSPHLETANTGEGFTITPKDASVLREHIEEFQSADTDDRTKLLEQMVRKLYAFRPANTVFDKNEAKWKIRTWFYNHYDRPHRQLVKFTQRWSARNAFFHKKKPDIMELTQQISGGVPGSQAFLGALQDATTQLWKELPAEEQECYAELAKEWSDD
ncbi:hypothetical protein EI94DRAFT_1808105 [Lactarius quietus]|nr:hypothetical protein EI94DRAFT_1808105 [Lactarius quietus]